MQFRKEKEELRTLQLTSRRLMANTTLFDVFAIKRFLNLAAFSSFFGIAKLSARNFTFRLALNSPSNEFSRDSKSGESGLNRANFRDIFFAMFALRHPIMGMKM